MITCSRVDYMSRKRDYTQESLTSPFAYKILREIYTGNSRNPTSIAESLDSTYYSINNYMKGFRDLDFVTSKRDGKKKIYAVNLDKIYSFWIDELDSTLQELKNEVDSGELEQYQLAGIDQDRFSKELAKDFPDYDIETEREFFESIKKTIEQAQNSLQIIKETKSFREFFVLWFEFYIHEKKESRLEDLLFHDLETGLHSIKDTDNEIFNESLQQDIKTILFALDPLSKGESISLATRVGVMMSFRENVRKKQISQLLDKLDDYETEEVAKGFVEAWKNLEDNSEED